ncbi:MAG: PilN domain-containing protein [Planctomycetota bacterium]|nr:PilN domain-containing protein [Planctomycetota bacterium]
MASQNNLSFLPDGYFENKAQRRANAICAVLFIIVMAGMWSAFTLSERATQRVDDEYLKTDLEFVGAAKRIQQVRQMQEKQNRMAHQANLTASLLEKVPRSFVLAEITNSMPAGVSLLDVVMESKDRPKPQKDIAPKTAYEVQKAAREAKTTAPLLVQAEAKLYDVTLKITGVAINDAQVAQFLKSLSASRLFRDTNLIVSEEYAQAEDKLKLRKFQIELAIERDVEPKPQTRPSSTAAVEVNN